jgi:hypothetical protein
MNDPMPDDELKGINLHHDYTPFTLPATGASMDNSIETCERCGGWVWHRKEPCDCSRKTLEQELAALKAENEMLREPKP